MDYRKILVASGLAFGLLSAPALSITTELSIKRIEVAGARVSSCPGGDSNCVSQQRPPEQSRSQIPNSYKRKAPPTLMGKNKPPKHQTMPCPPENPRCYGSNPPPAGGHKPPKHQHHHNYDYWWTPGYYWNPGYAFDPPTAYAYYRVSCDEARSILQYEGFRNIKLQKCGSTYHRFKAQRRGKTYLINVRARSGQIVIVRRL
jgi:hypothetical protein